MSPAGMMNEEHKEKWGIPEGMLSQKILPTANCKENDINI